MSRHHSENHVTTAREVRDSEGLNELLPSARIGKYVLRRRLGAGGMGEVYAAELLGAFDFRREVAIKVVRSVEGRQQDFRRLFLREGRALAALHHRNIVQVIELGEDGDQLYLVMELLSGIDLRQLFQKRGPLAPELALHLGAEVAHALAAAHSVRSAEAPNGLVHGDLSLSNIMLGTDGSVKVLDFGLARPAGEASSATAAAGKLAYLAPEVASGAPKDALTDLFALGVCLYELIDGLVPFRGKSDLETLHALLAGQAPPLQTSGPVRAFVERLISRDRTQRVQHAHDAALEAERLVAGSAGPSVLAALVKETLQEPSQPLPPAESVTQSLPERGTQSLPVVVAPERSRAAHAPWRWLFLMVLGLVAAAGGATVAWRVATTNAAPGPGASGPLQPVPQQVNLPPNPPGPGVPSPPPVVQREPKPTAHLSVRLDRNGAIEIDGRLVSRGTKSAGLDLEPGAHRVRVGAHGKWAVRDVQLEAGASTVLELQTPRASPRPAPSAKPDESELLDPLQ